MVEPSVLGGHAIVVIAVAAVQLSIVGRSSSSASPTETPLPTATECRCICQAASIDWGWLPLVFFIGGLTFAFVVGISFGACLRSLWGSSEIQKAGKGVWRQAALTA